MAASAAIYGAKQVHPQPMKATFFTHLGTALAEHDRISHCPKLCNSIL